MFHSESNFSISSSDSLKNIFDANKLEYGNSETSLIFILYLSEEQAATSLT